MNCGYVAENDVCENYLLGQLEMPEKVVFERHFAGCPGCFGKLAMARSLLNLMGEGEPTRCDA